MQCCKQNGQRGRAGMARFQIEDVVLRVPGHQLVPKLKEALSSGAYEHLEVRALTRVLVPGDRVLELGAGCGFLSIHAVRMGATVVAVEANPNMIDVIRRNLDINGADDVDLVHGAVVPQVTEPEVRFFLRGGFWAGSLEGRGGASETEVVAPAVALDDLIKTHDPSVMVVDVEGAEADLFQSWSPGRLRSIVVELHPRRYGPTETGRIFKGMSEKGFVFDPNGSRGKVVLFTRV